MSLFCTYAKLWISLDAAHIIYMFAVPQKDNFGDLLGNMGMPPPVQPTPATNGETAEAIDDKSPCKIQAMSFLNHD